MSDETKPKSWKNFALGDRTKNLLASLVVGRLADLDSLLVMTEEDSVEVPVTTKRYGKHHVQLHCQLPGEDTPRVYSVRLEELT